MEKTLYDLTVVGAGPVGLFGQLNALYPEKYIYDMPGFPKVMAKDLVKQLWEQAEFAKPTLHLGRKVAKIARTDQLLEITCESGEIFHSKTVMLALGMGAFKPRKLEVPGLAEREGRNVHYFVNKLDHFNGKNVLVIGGGDSAADWTLALGAPDGNGHVRAKSVTMIHRTDKFAAHEATIHLLRTLSGVKIQTHTELQSFHEEGTELRCQLVQNLTKEITHHSFDEIIVCAGYLAKLDFVKESGLEMQGNAIKVNERMETNVSGVFAVGDVCTHGGKLKLIATGVGEAAIAANFAKVQIDPNAKAFPGHSTSLFSKKEE
jgi:thioredoxin reductase